MEPRSSCCSTVPPPELQQQGLPDLAKNVSRFTEAHWSGGDGQSFPLGEILIQPTAARTYTKKKRKFIKLRQDDEEEDDEAAFAAAATEDEAEWCFYSGNEDELYSVDYTVSSPRSPFPAISAVLQQDEALLYPNPAILAATTTSLIATNPSLSSSPNSSVVPLNCFFSQTDDNNNNNKLFVSSSKNNNNNCCCCSSSDAYITSSLCNVNFANNNNITLKSGSCPSAIPSISSSNYCCASASASSPSPSSPLLTSSNSVLLQSHSHRHPILGLHNPNRNNSIDKPLHEPLGNGVLHPNLHKYIVHTSCSSSLQFSSSSSYNNNTSIKPYPISIYNNNNCNTSSDTRFILSTISCNTNQSAALASVLTTTAAPLQKAIAASSATIKITEVNSANISTDATTNADSQQQAIASSSPNLLYPSTNNCVNLTTEYLIDGGIQANGTHNHLQFAEFGLNRSINDEGAPNKVIIDSSRLAIPPGTIAKPQTQAPEQNPNPAGEYSAANPSSSSSSSKAANESPNPNSITNTTPTTSSNPNSTRQNPRNKVSVHPQGIAARRRRHRISHKFKILQTLVPGGTKMDTASMLDEAIHYIKYLRGQILLHQLLEAVGSNSSHNHGSNQVNLHHQQQGVNIPSFHNVENILFDSCHDRGGSPQPSNENLNPSKIKSSIYDINSNHSHPIPNVAFTQPFFQSPYVNFPPSRTISSCSNNSSISFPSGRNLPPYFIPM